MMLGGAWAAAQRSHRPRTALLGSVITFAVLTIAAAFVNTIPMLTFARPRGRRRPAARCQSGRARRRVCASPSPSLAITATIVCIPLGGFVGGLIAGQVVPL
jgi:AAHS family 4-hydroxybenzoate transporter-like MFS transporter